MNKIDEKPKISVITNLLIRNKETREVIVNQTDGLKGRQYTLETSKQNE
jgi:hypothetical protein